MTDRTRPALLLCFFLTASLMAQPSPPVDAAAPEAAQAEAPEAIFDQKVGDVGVVLDAEGTWTSRLAGGWGQGLGPQGALPGLGYPGYEKGVVFSQVPDFSLTLRLLERYYLEVVFGGSLDDRSFLVGYQGKEGEPVQWIKAGNVPFAVPSRAGQTLALGRQGAPAAGAAFSLGPVSTEVLARYEDGSRETRTYRGYQDTASGTVALDQWIRGRFFRIPGTGPFAGVQVAVADPSGPWQASGEHFRAATATEAVVDSSTGEIRLATAAGKAFLVSWAGASDPLEVQGIRSVPGALEGTGGSWFLLFRPGQASSFELRNRYPVPVGTTGAISLSDTRTGLTVAGYPVTWAPSQDWFEVAGGPEAAPFWDAEGGLLRGLYPTPTSPPPLAATLPWTFRLPVKAATDYSLGADVEPSSLVVVRNGLATTAYRFVPETGTLKLDGLVFDTDTVEVSFQRKKSGAKAADLVLWEGGRWDLAADQDLQWTLRGRWNLEQGRFTTEDFQAPGQLAATLAYRGSAGPWSWAASMTGGAVLADSTGHRRLYSHTNSGTSAALDGDSLRPSAVPGLATGSDGSVFGLGVAPSNTNRAFTFFRDFWSNDPLTGQAQVGPWGTPGIGRTAQVASGWMGPYLVRGDGQRTDRLAVAEADLGAHQWTGLQVFLDAGKPRNWGTSARVTVNFRLPNDGAVRNGLRLFFQAGTLSEDEDGTGTIRKVEFREKPALGWTDLANQGQTQYFAIPESSRWGNDADGDGTAGGDGALVSRALTWSDDGNWQTATLFLTDQERQALVRTTGWRLVAVNDSGVALPGVVVLVGPVVFEGSSWTVVSSGAATGTVNPVEVADPAWTNGHRLSVSWSGRPTWTLEGRHSPVRPVSFRTLSFRYRTPAGSGPLPLSLVLGDGSGQGLTAEWTASSGSGGWVQVRIGLKDGSFSLDGAPAAGAQVSLVTGADAWDRMTLSLKAGPTSGTLDLAEVECVDPVWEPIGTSQISTTWKQPGAWPSADLPLVSGWSVTAVSSQAGLTSEDFSWRGQTSVSGSLGPLRASGEASALRDARSSKAHGAYEATLPVGWSGGPLLEWTDRFSDEGLRSERAALTLPWLGLFEAKAKAEGPPVSLIQDYRLGWTAPSTWPQGWSARAAAGWTQTRPQSIALKDFGPQWIESWSWLVPGQELAPFVQLGAETSTSGLWGPVGWNLEAKNQVSQTLGPPVKWAPQGSWEAKLPLSSGTAAPWTLTPGLSRRVESVWSSVDSRDPATSGRDALRRLWTGGGSLTAAPFSEWASDSDGTSGSGAHSGLTETKAFVDWGRSPASDWTDLVVPLGLGSSLTGTRGHEGPGEYQAGAVAVRAQARALNLFGTQGSDPVFGWYRTDTLTWSASGAWGTGTRDQDHTATSGVDLRADLILTPAESLGLPVSYKGQWGTGASQAVGLQPVWSLRHPADLPIELPRWVSPKSFRRLWVQDVSGTLNLGWSEAPAPVVRNLQVGWKGRLLLSEKSEVALGTQFGAQWQNTLTLVGLSATLDLILTF